MTSGDTDADLVRVGRVVLVIGLVVSRLLLLALPTIALLTLGWLGVGLVAAEGFACVLADATQRRTS